MADILINTPDISFIESETTETILSRLVSNYESELSRLEGRTVKLSAASKIQAEINAVALELTQIYQIIDRAGKQGLLKYAYGAFLDNLAAAKNTERKTATAATVTVRFFLEETRESAVGIPAGTRVSNDGSIFFESQEYTEIESGNKYVDVNMICSEKGIIGNDIAIGNITTLVDPINYINEVSNITVSGGGCDIESDESLRKRIFLAPSSYSVAGPVDAYVYWVKTFNNDIADVNVSTDRGTAVVHIRVLLSEGRIPNAQTLSQLQEFINDSNIRPLTDQVVVEAPETVNYDIEFTYYINKSDRAKALAIQNAANEAVEKYIAWQSAVIGRDITPDKLVQFLMDAGVKRVEITSPVYTSISDQQVAKLNSETSITYGGIADD